MKNYFIKIEREYVNKVLELLDKLECFLLIKGNDFLLISCKKDVKKFFENNPKVKLIGEVNLSNIKIRRIRIKEV